MQSKNLPKELNLKSSLSQAVCANSHEPLVWIDILKILSALAIVLCHSVIAYSDTNDLAVWTKALLINALPRFGVPCFMMISAVWIGEKKDSIPTLFRKRIPRVVIPLVFWSAVYLLFRRFIGGEDFSMLAAAISFPFQHSYSHLWYSYFLVGLYLLSPIVAIFIDHSSKNQKILVIGIFFLGQLADMILQLTNLHVSELVPIGWNRLGLTEILFMIASIAFYKHIKSRGVSRALTIVGMLLGYGMMVLSSMHLRSITNEAPQYFLGHVHLSAIIFGASVFGFFFSCGASFQKLSKMSKRVIHSVSGLMMGVYFLHPAIGTLLMKGFDYFQIHIGGSTSARALLSMYPGLSLVYALLQFLISLAICFVMSKIPFVKKLVL